MSATSSHLAGMTFSDRGTGIPFNEAVEIEMRFAQYLGFRPAFFGSTKDMEQFSSPDQPPSETVFEMLHFGFAAGALAEIGGDAVRGLASVAQAYLKGRQSRRIEFDYEDQPSVLVGGPDADLEVLVAIIRRSQS